MEFKIVIHNQENIKIYKKKKYIREKCHFNQNIFMGLANDNRYNVYIKLKFCWKLCF